MFRDHDQGMATSTGGVGALLPQALLATTLMV
jgi:hypothetical protein